ncbi:hypothetical protein C8Q74DRAFT_476149 [Fomes fomentarius]|nr:hypothetical protein C8Q74DRAFT_476149 [Fomes fomentarius]
MSGHLSLVRLGGRPAVGLFIVCLFAFVAETQLSQYVQSSLGFNQPYLIFYAVHSAFAMSFPLHLIYLTTTTRHSITSLRKSLGDAVRRHLSPKSTPDTSLSSPTPAWGFLRLSLLLTAGMTLPSLFWFMAVALAPVTDVTALWNTNAFFAYLFAVFLSGAEWDARRLLAVLIATTGALAVVYGGSTVGVDEAGSSIESSQRGHKSPFLGDLLTLAASVMYGAYQVLYKLYAALPDDPEVQSDAAYAPLARSAEETYEDVESTGTTGTEEDVIRPLPFGLYPNMLTSAIGISTLLFLWIPIPVLNVMDIEPFELPHNLLTYCVILGIAFSGSVFNAGFMVLLGVWGPIVVSVGSLLTIVLVFLSDMIFGGAVDTLTVWSVLGCSSIVVAFAILAYDMASGR